MYLGIKYMSFTLPRQLLFETFCPDTYFMPYALIRLHKCKETCTDLHVQCLFLLYSFN